MEQYLIASYWKERKSTKEEVILAIKELLLCIVKFSVKEKMYYKGKSIKDPKSEVVITDDNIEKHLRRNKRDSDKSVIEELGYTFSCWSGDSKKPIDFSCLIGCYSDKVKNCVVVQLNEGFELNQESKTMFNTILTRVVDITIPDIALFTSLQLNQKNGNGMPIDQNGYINYRNGKYSYSKEYNEKIRPTTAST